MRLDLWQQLIDPAQAPLVDGAMAANAKDVAAVARLRKKHPAELVNLALDLASARRKLAAKWPDRFAQLAADPAGAEMASSELAAAHKAGIICSSGAARVVDLCCGIGGDAMGMTAAGLGVVGVDADPVRAWMCGVNAGCEARASDVLETSLPDGPFLLDPARRSDTSAGSRRVFALELHEPRPEVWREVIRRRGTGVIKLGPGLDFAEVSRAIGELPHRFEVLSERGQLTQALVWVGDWAVGREGWRTATMLGEHAACVEGAPDEVGEPEVGELSRYLVEADAAIERCGLLGVVAREQDLRTLASGLGLLTGEQVVKDARFQPFEVCGSFAWNERAIRLWLKEHDAGVVEVKTRAGVVNTDEVQKTLRGEGSVVYTVFVIRIGSIVRAVVTRRV